MGDTQITDTIRDLSSKRKYETIESHRRKNWEADSSKEKPKGIESDTCNVDQDYGQSSTGENDCNSDVVDYDAVDDDPHYKIFLDSLTVVENSYVLQVNEKNGLSKPLKYEVDDDSDDELELDIQQKMKNIIEENVGNDKSNSSSCYKVEAPIVSSNILDDKMSKSVVENDIISETVNSNPFGHQGLVVEEFGNGGTDVSDRMCKANMQDKKHKSRILRKSRKVTKGEKSKAAINVKKKKDDECDDDYLTFCNYLSSDGNNLVLKYKDSSPIVYETDEYLQNFRGSDDSVREDDDCHYISNPSRESHSFREQVMMILRKPYSSEEHQMLLQDIQARRPMERNMDLRFGREQSYVVKKDGKSYLDHHYDFKRKLQATESSHEELNLLRGFFFWLQNLTRAGAFKPWQDASCGALEPQAC